MRVITLYVLKLINVNVLIKRKKYVSLNPYLNVVRDELQFHSKYSLESAVLYTRN